MQTLRAGIAIPAYNCEKQIIRAIAALAQLPNLKEKVQHVWIIDNRSPDGTVEKSLRAIKENHVENWISVVRNSENYGLGGSHKVGFQLMEENKLDWMLLFLL